MCSSLSDYFIKSNVGIQCVAQGHWVCIYIYPVKAQYSFPGVYFHKAVQCWMTDPFLYFPLPTVWWTDFILCLEFAAIPCYTFPHYQLTQCSSAPHYTWGTRSNRNATAADSNVTLFQLSVILTAQWDGVEVLRRKESTGCLTGPLRHCRHWLLFCLHTCGELVSRLKKTTFSCAIWSCSN